MMLLSNFSPPVCPIASAVFSGCGRLEDSISRGDSHPATYKKPAGSVVPCRWFIRMHLNLDSTVLIAVAPAVDNLTRDRVGADLLAGQLINTCDANLSESMTRAEPGVEADKKSFKMHLSPYQAAA